MGAHWLGRLSAAVGAVAPARPARAGTNPGSVPTTASDPSSPAGGGGAPPSSTVSGRAHGLFTELARHARLARCAGVRYGAAPGVEAGGSPFRGTPALGGPLLRCRFLLLGWRPG
jgi:hypothetical protein